MTKYRIFSVLGLLLVSVGFSLAQNVGVNIADPAFLLDIRGTDDTDGGGEFQLSTPTQTNFLRLFGGQLGYPNPFIAFHELDTFHLATTSADYSTFKRRLTMLPNGFLGLGTDIPSAELDITSGDADDGVKVNLSNLNTTHFLRLYSGRQNLPIPLMYWNFGSALELGMADGDDSNYQRFLSLDGKTIGVHNTGRSVFIGEGAGANDDVDDNQNVAIGDSALYNNQSGNHSVAIGKNALFSSTSDGNNVAIGFQSGNQTDGGINNVFIGHYSAASNETGRDNVFLGKSAAWRSTDADFNTVIGGNAGGYLIDGTYNTMIGHTAGYGTLDGDWNVYIGTNVAANMAGTPNSENVLIGGGSGLQEPGNKNTVIGYLAGVNVEGLRNVIIGHRAGSSLDSFNNSIIIGADAGEDLSRDNTLIIDNTNTVAPLIYGEFDNNFIRINGSQDITGELNIDKTGVAMRVNHDEALWYDGSYFSWGYGADHNYSGRPMTIGPFEGSTTPFAQLHVIDDGFTYLQVESLDGDAILQLSGNTNSPSIGWTMRRDVSDGGKLQWRHDDFSKMTMTPSGNLGLGMTTPSHKLEVLGTFKQSAVLNGAYNFVAKIENSGNDNSSPNDALLVKGGHDVWAGGQSSSLIEFHRPDETYLGRIWQNGPNSLALATSSDERLKSYIVPTHYSLQDLLEIEVRDYYWNSDTDHKHLSTGFIAQQLYKHYPNAVNVGGDDPVKRPWAVDYSALTPLLVQSVQEQQELILALQKDNDDLRTRLDALEKHLTASVSKD